MRLLRWKEAVATAVVAAVYWRRLGFRGSSGFGAEVRNGLGRPTTSDISASSQLRLFPPGLRCAPAQRLRPALLSFRA